MAETTGQIILVTGGSRSGKSEFAERLVRALGVSCAYIATAQILDEEMRERVGRHRKRREDGFWSNYEAPFAAHQTLEQIGREDSILFDCVTIYISNLFSGQEQAADRENALFGQLGLLVAAARHSGKNVVFVTNEVGSGIVPFEPATREFRDLAGQANQMLAAAADKVYLVVSGIPVELKKLAEKLEAGGDAL